MGLGAQGGHHPKLWHGNTQKAQILEIYEVKHEKKRTNFITRTILALAGSNLDCLGIDTRGLMHKGGQHLKMMASVTCQRTKGVKYVQHLKADLSNLT